MKFSKPCGFKKISRIKGRLRWDDFSPHRKTHPLSLSPGFWGEERVRENFQYAILAVV
jgi:hypothetical protein